MTHAELLKRIAEWPLNDPSPEFDLAMSTAKYLVAAADADKYSPGFRARTLEVRDAWLNRLRRLTSDSLEAHRDGK